MASLEVPVEFSHNGIEVSASTLTREIVRLTQISYESALLIVASEIRKQVQSQDSLWPKPPTPPWIQRQRTGISQAGMYVLVADKTVVVANDVYYSKYVNYSRTFPVTNIPNWNYLAVERTLSRAWLRIRQRSHQIARRGRRARPINTRRGSARTGEILGLDGGSLFLPIIIWDREEDAASV